MSDKVQGIEDEFHGIDLSSVLVGAYWYCADYHSGQSSELYRLLCAIPYSPGRNESSPGDSVSAIVYSMFEDMGEIDSTSTIDRAIEAYEEN